MEGNVMTLAYIGYLMIAVLMAAIISKRMSAFAALIIVPLIFGTIACSMNGVSPLAMGKFIVDATKGMASNFSLLFYAITFFGIMISTGLFDPMIKFIVKLVKGDPAKVMAGTSIMAACVALDGDGTTTYLICCTAMLPIFTRLKMKKLYMAAAMCAQVTIMNNLPWGGPSARIITVCNLTAEELLRWLAPGMVLGVIFNICAAYWLGLQERKRLGVIDVEAFEHGVSLTEEEIRLRRPKLIVFNFILAVGSMVLLIVGLVPASVVFGIAAALALAVNYPTLEDQKNMVQVHGADSIQVICLILAAGVLMGVMNGTGMSDAMAKHMTGLVPASMGGHFPIITAVISCFGTFFLSNDACYYGVLPLLAEAGYAYGFTPLTMGVAAAMGQAFHLISPLVGSLWLLVQLSDENVTDIQRIMAIWGIGIFLCYIIASVITGVLPL